MKTIVSASLKKGSSVYDVCENLGYKIEDGVAVYTCPTYSLRITPSDDSSHFSLSASRGDLLFPFYQYQTPTYLEWTTPVFRMWQSNSPLIKTLSASLKDSF